MVRLTPLLLVFSASVVLPKSETLWAGCFYNYDSSSSLHFAFSHNQLLNRTRPPLTFGLINISFKGSFHKRAPLSKILWPLQPLPRLFVAAAFFSHPFFTLVTSSDLLHTICHCGIIFLHSSVIVWAYNHSALSFPNSHATFTVQYSVPACFAFLCSLER